MSALKNKDLSNLDYAEIGVALGAASGVIFGMYKGFGFGKTGLLALVFGAVGAYVGYSYQKMTNDEE